MRKALLIIPVLFIVIGMYYVSRDKSSHPSPPDATLSVHESNDEPSQTPWPSNVLSVTPEPTMGEIVLTIISPKDGATVYSPSLIVRGVTSSNAEVFVNEKEGKADSKGNFSVPVTLDEGDNYIVVTSTDADGNLSEQDITVTYQTE